jgi:hypothetical protein
MFQNNAELTFLGHRTVRSIIGGLISMALIVLIVLASFYFVGLYLSGRDFTISHVREPDNTIDKNGGLDLYSGENFKFGLTFMNETTQVFEDVSTNKYLGISLF